MRCLIELTPYLRETFKAEDDDDEEPVKLSESIYVECEACDALVTIVRTPFFLAHSGGTWHAISTRYPVSPNDYILNLGL